ncbi:fructosamine kinase family protein [Isoptericola sp. NEAU-Y5]|uniref:Fructosamine kinase family protein n=1 Tax=Isoptericola luteus TaxID=2879484 RepID=A0ABS7ZES3_9MICO|nr:fructosamine kinase family protein [Isoptericola sp. NEAU-Y5]MCA5893522.1 fructosamine kinase family protein [Isoptericola sp. NEAU-Y5]
MPGTETPGSPAAGAFRKARTGAPPGFFAAEAAGLRWLAVPGGPRVVRVVAAGESFLDLEHVDRSGPTRGAAHELGRRLAALHDAGAPAFGALPPRAGASDHAWFGPLDDPLPMAGGAWDDWPSFYADARVGPVVATGRERGVLTADDEAAAARVCARLHDLAGPAADDVPARLHGDLWSGNVLWARTPDGGTEAVLIDPAAHGGHRETDLAMLALFGAPHLEEILGGYAEEHPLAPGWQDRVALHQLYPLAVHAVLFGGSYVRATRSLLATLAGA